MKKTKQRKEKINISRSSKKVERNNKKEHQPSNWWKSLVDLVYSFIDLKVTEDRNVFEDTPLFSGRSNPKHITALQILFDLLVTYSLTREDSLQLRKCKGLYEKIMNRSFARTNPEIPPFLNVQDPWGAGEPPEVLPSFSSFTQTKSMRLLKEFYEKQEPRLYMDAVKLGLFETLYWEAETFGLTLKFAPEELEYSLEYIKDFFALIEWALYPIIKWRDLTAENNEDAKMNLQKVGESLNPGFKKGRKPKRPLGESTEFPHLYNTIVCILYGAILIEFQKASKVRLPLKSRLLEEGITGLISSKEDWDFRVNPNEAAKKVLIKLFDWDEERTLNTVLGKRSSLLDKLKTIRESLRQELETIPF